MSASKPVRLQFNQAGAWRNSLDFDAGNDEQASLVMRHGAELALVTNAKARIVLADGSQSCVSSWTKEKGWHDPFTGRGI